MGKLKHVYQSELPSRAVLVYLYLYDRANEKNECWPSIATISKDLKMSQSTVRRALNDLRKERMLETEQRYRTNGATSSLLFRLL